VDLENLGRAISGMCIRKNTHDEPGSREYSVKMPASRNRMLGRCAPASYADRNGRALDLNREKTALDPLEVVCFQGVMGEGGSMTVSQNVLVVEDERDLAELLRYNLNTAGYSAEIAADGQEALDAIGRARPDLIILDVMLPRMNGIEVARRLRSDEQTQRVPIIMLTAKSAEDDQVVGLDAGADDYITKPFSIRVLLARVEAVLRRGEHDQASTTMTLGMISVDLDRHEITVGGKPVRMTLTEFRVLGALMGRPGRVQSRQSLISSAIGPGITITERTVDVHVAAIRRKLGPAGPMLETIRGVGYRMSDRAEPIE